MVFLNYRLQPLLLRFDLHRVRFIGLFPAVCGKDLALVVAEYRLDLLPRQGPKEHAVWGVIGDVLIMRVILVGFNSVKLGGETRCPHSW